MFPIILGLAGVAVGLYLIVRWWSQAQPHQLVVALRWFAILAGVGVILFAILSRRWGLLAVLSVPAFALFRAWRVGRTFQRNAQGPSGGGSSSVETRFLRMTLDHDTGAMDGGVIDGPHAGRGLGDLTLGELIELWRICVVEDEESRTVLEAYLDRVHGDTWRQAAGGEANEPGSRKRSDSPWAQGGMSEDEAREILGIGAAAGRDEIEAAWRQAMQRAHPDHGGSDWLAARINQARDVLLDG